VKSSFGRSRAWQDGSMRDLGTEDQLIRAALDLGAAEAGGPLSRAEGALVRRASALPAQDVTALAAEIRAGGDPLGDVFVALRSPLARRVVGAFYTPVEIVTPMVAFALSHHPARLVDPGCGSGRFAAAAVRADPSLEIVAVDLDPLATLMTRAALAALGARHAQVRQADYLTVRLGDVAGKTAWVGNPPYVRHHDLSASSKAWANKAAKRLGHTISGLAGLHALFFLGTALRAAPGDVGCFVTAAEWLDVGYGSVVRSLLLNGLGGTALDLVDPRAMPFADAMTTALIASFVVGSKPDDIAIRIAASPEDLGDIGHGTPVSVCTMAATGRWSPLFRAGEIAIGIRLGDLARVHRGTVTGQNDFFAMTRAQAEERGLTRWARPAITSAAEIMISGGALLDSRERRVVIDLPADLDRTAHPAADVYLRAGEADGVPDRYVCSHRRPWWRLGLGEPPPIVATYMARQAPVFALNPDRLVLLNIGHGIWPKDGVDPRELVERLTMARQSFAGAGRTYHGGLEKFEPGEMEALILP
jgi:adenine-specific DNA-methyltransferase